MPNDQIHDDASSPTFQRFSDRLWAYTRERSELDDARQTPMPEHPWPAQDNVMLEYLVNRAIEIADTDGVNSAVIWLAAHAWFEGALEERFQETR